jgi:tRNA(fMet)-specific endonuclease VapC
VSYVLDTNAVSALMRGDAEIVARLRNTPKEQITIPQPVLAEIAYGIERLPRSRRKERLRQRYVWIREELPRLPWSDEVSDRFGTIKAHLERRGERIEDFDVAIAAHALATEATLVTADRDSASVSGLVLEDWSRKRER